MTAVATTNRPTAVGLSVGATVFVFLPAGSCGQSRDGGVATPYAVFGMPAIWPGS